jgi:hypothetical protein
MLGTLAKFNRHERMTVQQIYGQDFTVVKLFRTMLDNDCNILVNMTKAEYKDFRTLMVDMVLHTGHQEQM